MRQIIALAFAAALASSPAFAQGTLKRPGPDSDFKVTLLGTGTPTLRDDRFGPSTLVQVAGQNLVFDAGRGAAIRITQVGLPLSKINAYFMTHYHSDHVVGLPDILVTGLLVPSHARRKEPMPVYGPPGIKDLGAYLEKAFEIDIEIRHGEQKLPREGAHIDAKEFDKDGVVYEKDGVKVTAFRVDHGKAVKHAFGYKVEYGGRSVVISGDTKYDENLIKHAMGTDLLIHEVAFARPELLAGFPFSRVVLSVHTTPQECGNVFTKTKPKLAVYTHYVALGNNKIPEPTLDDIVKQIAAVLPDARVAPIRQAVAQREQAVAHMSRFAWIVSVVVLLAGALVTATTMLASVTERTQEIGILRAVGFRRAHIIRLVVIEALAVSAAGGVVGCLLGSAGAYLVGRWVGGMAQAAMPGFWLAASAFGLATLLGTASSLYPAMRAARLDPVLAFRQIDG
jgi:ribonuclease Z